MRRIKRVEAIKQNRHAQFASPLRYRRDRWIGGIEVLRVGVKFDLSNAEAGKSGEFVERGLAIRGVHGGDSVEMIGIGGHCGEKRVVLGSRSLRAAARDND